jgi:hypothetical protein
MELKIIDVLENECACVVGTKLVSFSGYEIYSLQF